MNMNELIAWCEEERAMMHKQIELMENGTFKPFSIEGTKQIDTTNHWIAEYQRRIAELDKIIARRNVP